jgi:hypothetical protein
MCVAELNVSLNQCNHRWYHLVRPCYQGAGLQNCPSKLALEGWEIKCDFCPFCADWPLSGDEFMLLGGNPHSRSSSFSSPLSRTPSLTTTVAAARRDSRTGSLARSDSSISSSRSSNAAFPAALAGSPVHAASERNRAMNSRVESYFVALPEEVSEARNKRQSTATPTWANWAVPVEEDESVRRGSDSTTSSTSAKIAAEAVAGKAGKAWKTAKRRSRDLTGFFR